MSWLDWNSIVNSRHGITDALKGTIQIQSVTVE